MIKINEKQVLEAIPKTKIGLTKYCEIQAILRSGTPVSDKEFQRLFNGFYKVRGRTQSWYASFYSIFETARQENWPFETILRTILSETGRVEASFSSKIRASIDENSAVIDSIVLSNLGFQLPKSNDPLRLPKIIKLYEDLNNQMERIRKSAIGIFIEKEFFDYHKVRSITPIKALDLTLWQIR
jgi:hypothetical protein